MSEQRLLDADWLDAVRVAPAFVAADGRVSATWTTEEADTAEPEPAVADALVAVAAVAADAVRAAAPGGSVDVRGRGLVALAVRSLLGPVARARDGAPEAVVDAVGSTETVAAALADVAEGGTVVLAGAPCESVGPIDLYSTVHLRGLQLVAAPLPLEVSLPAEHRGAVDVPPPDDVRPDGSVRDDAVWCRIGRPPA